jgi:hypothetical protein
MTEKEKLENDLGFMTCEICECGCEQDRIEIEKVYNNKMQETLKRLRKIEIENG